MAYDDEPRITPQMVFLGRGARTLPPSRRLLLDAVCALVTAVVLIAMAFAFGFERGYAVLYISIFGAVQVAAALLRYLGARRR